MDYFLAPFLIIGAGLSVVRPMIGVISRSSTPSDDFARQSKVNFRLEARTAK